MVSAADAEPVRRLWFSNRTFGPLDRPGHTPNLDQRLQFSICNALLRQEVILHISQKRDGDFGSWRAPRARDLRHFNLWDRRTLMRPNLPRPPLPPRLQIMFVLQN